MFIELRRITPNSIVELSCGLLKFLITDLSSQLGIHPIISIEEYTGFFLSLTL